MIPITLTTSPRIFYWQGERYDISLLIQAMIMIVIHTTLLHVALVNRPSDAMPINHKPFEAASNESTSSPRPYSFWQWRSRKPYWQFLGYYVGTLVVLQLIFGVTPSFVKLQGMVALSIEALLPIPQILANQRNKSCKGFRISLLINWLFGDALKMMFFFMAKSDIPLAFKLCGTFQAMCDCYLGIQYYMFGNGVEHDDVLLRKE